MAGAGRERQLIGVDSMTAIVALPPLTLRGMAARVVSRIVRLEMIIVLLGHWRRWGRERRFSFLARTTVPRWNQSRRSRLAVGPHGVPKSRRHRGIVGPGVLHHLRRSLTPMARGSKRVAGPLWDVGAALSADQLYEMQSLMATERTGVYGPLLGCKHSVLWL